MENTRKVECGVWLFLSCFLPAFLFGCAHLFPQHSLTPINTADTTDFIATFKYQSPGLYIKSGFSFNIENKQDIGIAIVWDESAFIDTKGKAKRIIHDGIKYIEREKPQTPTIIPPKSQITGFILPAENIYWDSVNKIWNSHPVFYKGDSGKCSIFLTYTIEGKKKEVTYHFEAKEITSAK